MERRSFIRQVPKWLEVNSVECSFGKNGNCGDTSSQFLVATKKVETNFGIFFEERREKKMAPRLKVEKHLAERHLVDANSFKRDLCRTIGFFL